MVRTSHPGLIQASDGNLHVLLWTDTITVENLDRSLTYALSLSAQHREGIIALNVVAHGLSLPDTVAQRRANEVSRSLDSAVTATIVVLPGEGFWVSAARGFLTGLNLVSPLRGKRTIARNVEEGVRTAASLSGRTPQWARHVAGTLEGWIEEAHQAPGP
ncbi:MAG: hypothetical protein R3B40_29655 [Polyangiales bacterium]|nr:hypothetical protein [Sandaracinaceae bacterium]